MTIESRKYFHTFVYLNLKFSCPYLTQKLTIAVPIISGVLFLFVLLLLFRTACTDPGIIPRSEKDEITYQEKLYNGEIHHHHYHLSSPII